MAEFMKLGNVVLNTDRITMYAWVPGATVEAGELQIFLAGRNEPFFERGEAGRKMLDVLDAICKPKKSASQ